ncbi:hypothetical protein C2G38_2078904, partial [Gigaspora rosea]
MSLLLGVKFVDVWVGVGTTKGGILLLMSALRKWFLPLVLLLQVVKHVSALQVAEFV